MNYLDYEIKEHLTPALQNVGFVQIKPKHFQRCREIFMDEIWFQMSGFRKGVFYIHFECGLVNSRSKKILYNTGDRYDRSNSGIEWEADTKEKARKAILDVVNLLRATVIPWLDNIKTAQDFFVEECMLNYRKHGGTIVDFFDDERLRLAKVNKECFFKEVQKYSDMMEDTIENHVSEMQRIVTYPLTREEMEAELEKVHKKIEKIKKANRKNLKNIFKECTEYED